MPEASRSARFCRLLGPAIIPSIAREADPYLRPARAKRKMSWPTGLGGEPPSPWRRRIWCQPNRVGHIIALRMNDLAPRGIVRGRRCTMTVPADGQSHNGPLSARLHYSPAESSLN